jgi:phosphatidylserine/phosphatidylglycerophosphate/cardiolipin synthase-like enzyme
MSWNDDTFGIVRKAKEVKVFSTGATWGMKLSQLARQSGVVRIQTYSLPRMEYVRSIFEKRPNGIFLLCHSKFRELAIQIKSVFPAIEIAVHPATHAKIVLIEPETTYVGSANFGHSNWLEAEVGIRNKDIHDWMLIRFNSAFMEAEKIA